MIKAKELNYKGVETRDLDYRDMRVAQREDIYFRRKAAEKN